MVIFSSKEHVTFKDKSQENAGDPKKHLVWVKFLYYALEKKSWCNIDLVPLL